MVWQTIAATPPLLSVKMAYCSPKTDLARGLSHKKLASEAYRAIGGVARNSIANRAKVGRAEEEKPMAFRIVYSKFGYSSEFRVFSLENIESLVLTCALEVFIKNLLFRYGPRFFHL